MQRTFVSIPPLPLKTMGVPHGVAHLAADFNVWRGRGPWIPAHPPVVTGDENFTLLHLEQDLLAFQSAVLDNFAIEGN
jgi:hypothetical protein